MKISRRFFAVALIGAVLLSMPIDGMAQSHKHHSHKRHAATEKKSVNISTEKFELMAEEGEWLDSDPATLWADSVMNKMSLRQRVAQMMVLRVPLNMNAKQQKSFEKLIRDNEVGGVCFFVGTASQTLPQIKSYQSVSKFPLLVCIDGEWGLGMRLKDCYSFPHQMLMGALASEDDTLIYQVGKEIGIQCKKMGIHINFAPVVDLNSNPKNPVIGIRSFGEIKERVARKGIMYMRGMQSEGVMACAKHFPGHGDTDVDSHEDLPVINHTREYIDSVDLYPFRKMFDAGVGSVMIAHLQINALDNTPHQPSSLSEPIVTQLLRKKMGYKGLIITDGIDMKGVTKYYKDGNAELQALRAGNDLIILPPDVEKSISLICSEAKTDTALMHRIDEHCRRILKAKYSCGLNKLDVSKLELPNEEDWNRCDSLAFQVALRGVTLLNRHKWTPGAPVDVYCTTPYKIPVKESHEKGVIVGYEDIDVVRRAIDTLLTGRYPFKGTLPVTACGYQAGTEIDLVAPTEDPYQDVTAAGMDSNCFKQIDSIAIRGIENEAYPGCRILVAKGGKVVYDRAYGRMTYDVDAAPVELNSIYDLASLTKVTATTIAVMKLVDAGKIRLDDPLSRYLPYLKKTNKKHITIRQALSHIARLQAFDNYWKDAQIVENPYQYVLDRIADSKLTDKRTYLYSDFGFILLADMVKQVSGQTLDVFMQEHFYGPMGMEHTSFNPLQHGFAIDSIAPTELDKTYRHRLVHGTVHDQNADVMGGVSGHAGLFSTAEDIYKLCSMLLKDGMYGGQQYLSKAVIDTFNCRYYTKFGNRRALGFDKPFISSKSTHIAPEATQSSFGHTGFTGTMLWVDPEYDLVYIFLSNRVYLNATPNKLAKMNIRTDIQSLIYKSFLNIPK